MWVPWRSTGFEPDRRGDRYLSLSPPAARRAAGPLRRRCGGGERRRLGGGADYDAAYLLHLSGGGRLRAIRAAVDAKAAPADAAAADVDGWLTIELLEMRNGEWQSPSRVSLGARRRDRGGRHAFRGPIFDAFDADVGRVLVADVAPPHPRAAILLFAAGGSDAGLRSRADAAKRAAAAADADDDADDGGGGDGDASPPSSGGGGGGGRAQARSFGEPVHLAVPRAGARVLLEVQLGGETPLLRCAHVAPRPSRRRRSRLVEIAAASAWRRALARLEQQWAPKRTLTPLRCDSRSSSSPPAGCGGRSAPRRTRCATASIGRRRRRCAVHGPRRPRPAGGDAMADSVRRQRCARRGGEGCWRSVPPPPAAARRRTAEEVRLRRRRWRCVCRPPLA